MSQILRWILGQKVMSIYREPVVLQNLLILMLLMVPKTTDAASRFSTLFSVSAIDQNHNHEYQLRNWVFDPVQRIQLTAG